MTPSFGNLSNGFMLFSRYRAMFDVLDMPWAWPVDVNYHEARAFCQWKGPEYRLLVEAEHNVVRGPQVRCCCQTSVIRVFV